jgi:dihydroflavonol-4-reductase
MPSTYLITGGLGFLGQHIVKALHSYDPQAELRVLVRTRRQTVEGVENLPGVRLVSGNLEQPESLAEALTGAQTVVHNAALVSFKAADAPALYRANIEGTRHLIEQAAAQGCSNFIFISSISTIGRGDSLPLDETHFPAPAEKQAADPYGYSKLMGEQIVKAYTDRLRVIILNPSVILGPGSRMVAPLMRGLRWIPVLPMITTLNSFVDARDVAQAVVLALSRGRSGERYLVTGHNVDMLTFTRTALAAVGRRTPVFPVSPRLLRVGDGLIDLLERLHLNPGMRRPSALNVDKAYDTTKIRGELGWEPRYSLEQSLRDSLQANPRTGAQT